MKELVFLLIILSLLLFLPHESSYATEGEENQTFNVTAHVNLNLTLSPAVAWWNDTINASGYAVWSTGEKFNQTVEVNRTDGEKACSTTANNQTGFFNCSFNAPLELGNHYYVASAVNSTGGIEGNSSTTLMRVAPNYGQKPIGTVSRVVFEIPIIIQDLNGKVRQAWARIMIWKG